MKLFLISEGIRKWFNFVFMQTMKVNLDCHVRITEKTFDFIQRWKLYRIFVLSKPGFWLVWRWKYFICRLIVCQSCSIVIVKRKKLQDTVKKQITTLAGIKKKLLIGKADQFLGKPQKLYILWRIVITLTKFPTYFVKYVFLIYGNS